MKNKTIIILLALAMSLTGCKTDSTDTNNPQESVSHNESSDFKFWYETYDFGTETKEFSLGY